MNLIREYAKTIAAFFATYLANAFVSLVDGGTPWPQGKDEWLQYALTTVGAAVAAWLARNKITQKQLDKDPNVVGGKVVEPPATDIDDTPKPTPGLGGYRNPWRK